MRLSRGLICIVASIALSTPALAASLDSVSGNVMVNRGNGYKPVKGPTQLNPGDMIVVGAGGSAQISFPDGCSVPVGVGAVMTVGGQSPCATQVGPGVGGTEIFVISAAVAAGTVGFLLSSQKKDKAASP